MPKLKNILIFIAIAAVFVLVYIFFIKPKGEEASLVSTTPASVLPKDTTATTGTVSGDGSKAAQEFLTLLLGVRSIKLDSAIFSDPAFSSLHDSSIILVQDGNEGRVNPFAPLGSDAVTLPPIVPLTCNSPQILNTTTNTCVNLPL